MPEDKKPTPAAATPTPKIGPLGKAPEDPNMVKPPKQGFVSAPTIKKPIGKEGVKVINKAAAQVSQDFGPMTKVDDLEQLQATREKELQIAKEQGYNIQNLFNSAKNNFGKVRIGNEDITSPADLLTALQDRNKKELFYFDNRHALVNNFDIYTLNDLDAKVSGGLTTIEKSNLKALPERTIFDYTEVKAPTFGQPGYRPQTDPMGGSQLDPQNKFELGQKNYSAIQTYKKVVANGLNVTADGTKLNSYQDYFTYLADPQQRDAYGRKYNKQLSNSELVSASNILKDSQILLNGASTVQLDAKKQQVMDDVRVNTADDHISTTLLGKTATVYDEDIENPKSLPALTEDDLGRVVYEYENGNEITLSVGNNDKNLQDKTDYTYKDLVNYYSKVGLTGDEIDAKFAKYKQNYIYNQANGNLQAKRKAEGFFENENGQLISKYDQSKEQRARTEMSDVDNQIADLYDELRGIYESRRAGASEIDKKAYGPTVSKSIFASSPTLGLDGQQIKRISAINTSIAKLKQQAGYNAPEFFDPSGKRIDQPEQLQKVTQTYTQSLEEDKQSDIVYLKQKRNALYEQLDILKEKIDKVKNVTSKVEVTAPEGFEADNTAYLVKLYQSFTGVLGQLGQPQSQGEINNQAYVGKLLDQYADLSARVKATNKLIYTNTDLTKQAEDGWVKTFGKSAAKQVAETFTGDIYNTVNDEIEQTANFLTENGYYVSPEIKEKLNTIYENKTIGEGFLESLKIGIEMSGYSRGGAAELKNIFTGQKALLLRSYMMSRYGQTGSAAFNLMESAVVKYGVPIFSWEASGQSGSGAVAEQVGTQMYDKLTGVMKFGNLIPSNIFGRLMFTAGRTLFGTGGQMTEETFSNTWSVMQQNGFDIMDAVKRAYGDTEDERLLNLRATATLCFTMSALNLENVDLVLKTDQNFRAHLDALGTPPSAVDTEILRMLNETIKHSGWDETKTPLVVQAAGTNMSGDVPVTAPSPTAQNNIEGSSATASATPSSSETDVKVEKRQGNLGETFYVAENNGAIDGRVSYRYNAETGALEAKGLTSTSDGFVSLNEATQKHIETKSITNGIAPAAKVESLAKQNLGITEEQTENLPEDNNVLYQTPQNETGRRKQERVDKTVQSAEKRFNASLAQKAQRVLGLFTGVAENVDETDPKVRQKMSDYRNAIGNKLRVNMSSFFIDGKAVITNLVGKKIGKVADYASALLTDFDKSFDETIDTDLNTGQPVTRRKSGNVIDKLKEGIARSNFFNEKLRPLVDSGKMTEEEAINNLMADMLLNNVSVVKDIFGNDAPAYEAFKSMRKDFNNYVANKYTGSNSFSSNENFLQNTIMSDSTTKNRKSDYNKKAQDVANAQNRRNEIAATLSDTGQGVDVAQVDGVRFLDNEITAKEYLDNSNVDTAGMTPDQMIAEAERLANSSVNMDTYKQALSLEEENQAAKKKHVAELNRMAKGVFGIKTNNPLRRRKMIKQRQSIAAVSYALLKSNAHRAGMSMSDFMKNAVEFKKYTEVAFNALIRQNQNVTTLYQAIGRVGAEKLGADFSKAFELEEQGFTQEQVLQMTGFTKDANGEYVYQVPQTAVPKLGTFNGTMFNEIVQKVFPNFPAIQTTVSKKKFLRFNNVNSGTYTMGDLYMSHPVFDAYPDARSVSVQVINKPGADPYLFVPNAFYKEGKGSTPGKIVINTASLPQGMTGADLEMAVAGQFQNAIQHIEGVYNRPQKDAFVNPNSVRTAINTLRLNEEATSDDVEFMNSMLDAFQNASIFQFSSYRSAFADIANILIGRNMMSEKALDINDEYSPISLLAQKYGLNDSETKELATQFANAINKLEAADNLDASSPNKTNNVMRLCLTLSGLNESQLNNSELSVKEAMNLLEAKSSLTNAIFKNLFEGPQSLTQVEKDLLAKNQDQVSQINPSPKLEATYNDILDGYADFAEVFKDVQPYMQYLDENAKAKLQGLIDLVERLKNNPFKIYESDDLLGPINKITADLNQKAEDYANELNDMAAQAMENLVDNITTASESLNSILQGVTELSSAISMGDQLVTSQFANQESFYRAFPGIDSVENGIFDPYKPVSEFTESELKGLLVPNYMSEADFGKKYEAFKVNPSAFKGSVADNFIGKKELTTAAKNKALVEAKVQESIARNIGTQFYNNIDRAYATLMVDPNPSVNKAQNTVEAWDTLLKKYGAKQYELNYMGWTTFKSDNAVDGKLTAGQIQTWINSNRVNLSVFDPSQIESQTQVKDVYLYRSTESDPYLATGILESGEYFEIEVTPTLIEKLKEELSSTVDKTSEEFKNYSDAFTKLAAMGTVNPDVPSMKQALKTVLNARVRAMQNNYQQIGPTKETGDRIPKITNEYERYSLYYSELDTFGQPFQNKSYHELLISYPNRSVTKSNEAKAELLKTLNQLQEFEKQRTAQNAASTDSEILTLRNKIDELNAEIDIPNNYTSNTATSKNHFADPNVQLHARVNIQVDSQGNPLLFINEIQSDLAQNIRKESSYLINKRIAEIVLGRTLSDTAGNPLNDAAVQIAMNQTEIAEWKNNKDNDKQYAAITEQVKEEFKGYSPVDPNQIAMMGLKHAINFAIENGITKIQMNRAEFAGLSVGAITNKQSKGMEYSYNSLIPKAIKELQKTLKFEIKSEKNGTVGQDYDPYELPSDDDLYKMFSVLYSHEKTGFVTQLAKDPKNKKWIEFLLKSEYGFNDFEISQIDVNSQKSFIDLPQRQLDWVTSNFGKPMQGITTEEVLDTYGEDFKNTFGRELTANDVEQLMADPRAFAMQNAMKLAYTNNYDFVTMNVTPETKDIVAAGMALFQQDQAGAHGATVFQDHGPTIIAALTDANFSTPLHELAHLREKYMTPEERLIVMEAAGHDTWSRETSEYFARGFEKYLYEGIAPSSKLAKAFENMRKWMLQVYGSVKGSDIDIQLTPEMRRIYDAMLGQAKTTAVANKIDVDKSIYDEIAVFADEIKANPEFAGITDGEMYSALLKKGFDPVDLQDYFALRSRKNVPTQMENKGQFRDEANTIQNEQETMRTIRDEKALTEEIENIDPLDLPHMLEALEDVVSDGDIPFAILIRDLLQMKANNADPQQIKEQYAKILKIGTGVGRMLQMMRQLNGESIEMNARGLFKKAERDGKVIPEGGKTKILALAQQLDQLKEKLKSARDAAATNPLGVSKNDPTKNNIEYFKSVQEEYKGLVESYVSERMPYEGTSSLTDLYRSLVKGGLMTPSSFSVNTLSNVTKFFTNFVVDPFLSRPISFLRSKITGEEQATKKGLRDALRGVKYGFPSGLKRAWKILKNGSVIEAYDNPGAFVQSFNSFKSFANTVGMVVSLGQRKLGYNDLTNDEIASTYKIKLDQETGKISTKDSIKKAIEGSFGVIPDVVFRIMGATDAVFRDYAYYSTVAEQFKNQPDNKRIETQLKDASIPADEKTRLQKEQRALRKAYMILNSDYGNDVANADAMRYVYTVDNDVTKAIAGIQKGLSSTEKATGSFLPKVLKVLGTGVVPFTKIPTNYAVELMEFLIPEYALYKVGVQGKKRVVRMLKGDTRTAEEIQSESFTSNREMDRILGRAIAGATIQYVAGAIAQSGAVSGSPDDEDNQGKARTLAYKFERPYSINLSLLKAYFNGERKDALWDPENDLIVDYRSFGLFGASLYLQNKFAKDSGKEPNTEFANRGVLEKANNMFFGNFGDAGEYILDQTFVRGINSFAKILTETDEDKLASSLADFTITLTAGILPNTLSFIDKMNRKYMVDYDAKEAPSFKAFGMEVESTFATTYWTKMAIKLSERWPMGDPTKFVDLPFVESQFNEIPVKVDPFGMPVLQTPEGSIMGKFLYNTFDVTKATRGIAGYDVPDWEALVYYATKKGEFWDAIPSLPPRTLTDERGVKYKLNPNEYNNYVMFNALKRRELVEKALIKNGVYKKFIDMESELNMDQINKTPKTGKGNVLFGYEQLGAVLSTVYAAADKACLLSYFDLISAEREKMRKDQPDKYKKLVEDESKSVYGKAVSDKIYGGLDESSATNNHKATAVRRVNNGKVSYPYKIDEQSVWTNITEQEISKYVTGTMTDLRNFTVKNPIVPKSNTVTLKDGTQMVVETPAAKSIPKAAASEQKGGGKQVTLSDGTVMIID
jgi:hypothetical protein